MKISTTLFNIWNENKLSYCHWKSNEHIYPALEGLTDLDVLLSPYNKSKGEEIMRSLGMLQCKAQYGSRYPNVDDWIGFDYETGKLIHVHLHYQIVTGHKGMKEYNLPWTKLALDTRVFSPQHGLYMMEPNLELITLYTRFGLKADIVKIHKAKIGKFHLGEDDVKEVRYLKERIDMDRLKSLADTFFKGDSSDFFEIITENELTSRSFLKLIAICERVFEDNRRHQNLYNFKKKYWRFWMRLRKEWNTRLNITAINRKTSIVGSGIVIAFLGQDGSGKSTVTEDIEKWLTWKIDAKRFYMGSGDHWNPWQKSALRLIPNISLFKPLRGLISLSQTMSLANVKLNVINKAHDYKNHGGIALFDRFPQTVYKGINDGPRIRVKYMSILGKGFLKPIVEWLASREEKKLELACNMPPQIVFKLMLSPEESMRRKPFEKYEEVKKKHEIVKQLEFPDSDVYTIDATQPYEEELLQIKRIIWQHIPK